ncbi:DUF72 domain-containing protein [Rugamonas aquatica]|uniref:DUF72 domain-containing protein n=1 Tax=Rugamonas aquatica TaxID=2743357 RepID=A0A6A7N255_9BURK|nr:DUF72 domain-containing protein [Rugamonas aquatica]MQA39113.1 DUF72 domain-containing protein [Rugamonas aquatica]
MTHTRVGCASWSIDRASAPQFAADGSHLQRYARVMNAVEINSSFYRPHQASTYERWAADVPDDFRFSVKLARSITHDRRLQQVDELLARFAGEAGALGPKLGCVLVQLPPSLVLDAAPAGALFGRIARLLDCRIACEARHHSWFTGAATALLREHGVTRVIADPPAGQPGPYVATGDTVYARLHGSPRMYYSSYTDEYLDSVAAYLAGKDGWVIFDNTAAGAALPNALALMEKQIKQRSA